MRGYDVAVVGAGIVGCAVAHACADRGARVLLLDRGEPGSQASGAAAGMLAPCSEAEAPGPFLDAARAALALWPDLAAHVGEQSGEDCELDLSGLLRIAADAAEATELRSRLAWQQRLGVEASWLDGPDVRDADPACGPAPHGAALYRGEGRVHSPRSVRALVSALGILGGDLLPGREVTAATPGGGLLLSTGEEVRGATVVLAAGAWTTGVARALGLPAPEVRPVRGQLLALSGLARPPRHVLYGGRAGYAVARRDGQVLIGATEEDSGFDVRVTPAATARLLTVARTLLAEAGTATVCGAWAGVRPRSADGLPLLGPLGELSGGVRVLLAAGHFRNGVLLAPWTAAGMVDAALEGRIPKAWIPFLPSRRVAA